MAVNHLLLNCITDIAAMNEDKNISLEDLKQTLGKIWQPECRESGWSLR